MPIYLFKCQSCRAKFEKSLAIKSSEEAVPCPQCQQIAQKLPPQGVMTVMKESTKIPKDIDKVVGADAEKRWGEYEERKNMKEKIRQESGTEKLSRDPDGNYSPLSVTKDGSVVSEQEAVQLRKEMYKDYVTIKNDPETEKVTSEE